MKARPESGLGHYQLAVALLKLKRTAEAVPHLDRAVALRPNDRIAADTLARVLATSPEASLRNGARAVMLSEGICQPREQAPAAFLETLAAAYAETGAFDKARATAELALASARAAKDTTLAGRLQNRSPCIRPGAHSGRGRSRDRASRPTGARLSRRLIPGNFHDAIYSLGLLTAGGVVPRCRLRFGPSAFAHVANRGIRGAS